MFQGYVFINCVPSSFKERLLFSFEHLLLWNRRLEWLRVKANVYEGVHPQEAMRSSN